MSDLKVRGRVHVIEPTKSYGQSGFRKRLVVLTQEFERFTNYIPVEFIRDACDSADDISIGDEIEVSFRLSGRKWQRDPESEVKYFVNVEAMSFQKVQGASGGPPEEFGGDADGGSASGGGASSEGGSSDDINDQLSGASESEGDDIPF